LYLILYFMLFRSHLSIAFFFYYSADHRHLHSFPTRRSSDLCPRCATGWSAWRRRRRSGCAPRQSPRRRVAGWPWSTAPVSVPAADRKSTRLNSSHVAISYAVFCLKKKKKTTSVICLLYDSL